jgi:uncharacterized protein YcbK (DUF882 family)
MRRFLMALGCVATLSACASAPNLYAGYGQSFGTYVAGSEVNAFCISPKLRFAIWSFESHFGRKIVMNSGYRDGDHNTKAGGQDNSYHMKCEAADFFIPGVEKSRLIAFAYQNDLVGGLGCYPGRSFIHIDVRDRPAGWTKPVTFSGC